MKGSVIFAKPENEGNISSFGALMVSTASRVGTGNIIGVSTAICLGGPGAIFWMWLTAFFGGATALMCLSTGVQPEPELAGAAYVQASMRAALGSFGPIFIAVSLSLFAFTTLIGNYSYCEGCLEFVMNRKIKKAELLIFRALASVLVFVGAVASAGLVWDTADMLQGLIVVVNMPAILLLGGTAKRCLDDYTRQRKTTEKPVFLAKDINLREDVDFWK